MQMAKNIIKKQEKGISNATSDITKKTTPQPTANSNDGFPIGRQNYILLLIGFGIIILGFVLMIGGGSDNPDVFNYDGLFGFQRRTLAPIIVLAGFAFEVYAIMKKPKE